MRLFCFLLVAACFAVPATAHDTFLKFKSHFVAPNTQATVYLVNGTFNESENSVALNRMQDVRLVGPQSQRLVPKQSQWRLSETLNTLSIKTGSAGTYALGVSIKPRMIEMTPEKFDSYLKHDGVLDILAKRQKTQRSTSKVREKYSKHVKALFQVGEGETDAYQEAFGYPIEIVPLKNPLALKVQDNLPVKVLLRGKPLANQLVYANYPGFHKHDEDGSHIEAVKTRTDADGIAQIKLTQTGRWYVRLIHMEPSNEENVDYESNWATLTFELK